MAKIDSHSQSRIQQLTASLQNTKTELHSGQESLRKLGKEQGETQRAIQGLQETNEQLMATS